MIPTLALLAFVTAATPSPWTLAGREGFSTGELEGLVLDPDGILSLGPTLEEAARFESKYAWSLSVAPDGAFLVGTGEPAGVYLVTGTKRDVVWEAPNARSAEVYAAFAARDGSYWWGVSPLGKVYHRTASGETEEYDLPDSYVWAFAETPRGVFCATGSAQVEKGGAVYRLSSGNAQLVVRLDEPHILALVASGATLYGGTSGKGILFSLDPGDTSTYRILFDPDAEEITSLAASPEGIYILLPSGEKNQLTGASAVLASALAEAMSAAASEGGEEFSALGIDPGAVLPALLPGMAESMALIAPPSAVPPPPMPPSHAPQVSPPVQAPQASQAPRRAAPPAPGRRPTTVRRVSSGPQRPGGPRPPSPGGGAGSIHLLRPDGVVLPIAMLETAVRQIAWTREGLLYAEVEGGGLYQVEGPGRTRLLARPSVEGILAVAEGGFLSREGTTLFRIGAKGHEGRFRSTPFDAASPSRWGVVDFLGRGRIELRLRAGNTSEPGPGWTNWTGPYLAPFATIGLPRARFVQVEAKLHDDPAGGSPTLQQITVSFQTMNHPPQITKVSVKPLLEFAQEGAQNLGKIGPIGNYLQQVVQMESRNARSGEALPAGLSAEDLLVPIHGFLVASWEAADADEDELSFRAVLLGEGEPMGRVIGEDLSEPILLLNGAALPEGWYRLRVEATDVDGRPAVTGETATLLSLPFLVDHTPPVLASVAWERVAGGIEVRGEARDDLGAVKGIEIALDAEEFRRILPIDGIADSPSESFRFNQPLGPGPHLLLIRAADEAGNIGILRLSIPHPLPLPAER